MTKTMDSQHDPFLDPDADLDSLLAALAPAQPVQADGLMARILTDALREQPRAPALVRATAPPAPSPRLSGGWIGALADVFGGRGALAGLTLATLSGLYLGIAQPAALSGLTAWGTETPLASLDLLSGSDTLWTEAAP